jgi:undecaprenyl-diphosphatase
VNRPLLLAAAVALALLAAAAALSFAAAANDRFRGDLRLARAIQDLPAPGVTASKGLRAIGGTEASLAAGAVAAVVLWRRGWRRESAFLVAGLAALPFAQAGLKDLVDRPRPSAGIIERHGDYGGNSFPAGHGMSPALVLGYLVLITWLRPARVRLRAALIAAAAIFLPLQVLGNVQLGAHWPSCMAGGILWGAALAWPLAVAATLPVTRRASSPPPRPPGRTPASRG